LEIGALPIRHRLTDRLEKVLGSLSMLRPLLHRRAATLSGGQRQMLGVARALMSDPTLLILDEPSAGLAPAVLEEVFAEVRGIHATGVSILMVEQKARQSLAMADYGYVLDQGQNRLEGTGQAWLGDPEVVRRRGGGRAVGDRSALRRGRPPLAHPGGRPGCRPRSQAPRWAHGGGDGGGAGRARAQVPAGAPVRHPDRDPRRPGPHGDGAVPVRAPRRRRVLYRRGLREPPPRGAGVPPSGAPPRR